MPHLLLVDDNPQVCEMVIDCLMEDIGARVDCAHNGRDGATLLKCHHYDLAVIDGMLPEMSGLELAELAANENTPVLVICGHPVTCEILDRFGFPHLKKPFDIDALIGDAQSIIQNTRENILRVHKAAAAMRVHTEVLKALLEDSRRLMVAAAVSAGTLRKAAEGAGHGAGAGEPIEPG